MRTKPLIGRKVWFGPRRFGWGLVPVSIEGWAVLAIGIATAAVVASADRHARWLGLVVAAVTIIITLLKGTSPGGPAAWDEFQASRGR
jgi:hypothetical protein